ncbi:MAG: radical SAM protein [Deltaproteobacteria bacterium]|nr:radical SAM protein [Deltaproteobacteria bacterium]
MISVAPRGVPVEASYLRLYRSGELQQRVEQARALLTPCRVCPRRCGVDRLAGEPGICGTGAAALVASLHPHFGEEAPLVGQRGSGTIFFGSCNLLCCFCQNHDISHRPPLAGARHGLLDDGVIEAAPGQIAAMMLELAARGCHNINLVTPSHVVPQWLAALPLAIAAGLRLPLVYNSGGYDALETLRLLDGVVDIYMPDFKFWDDAWARRLCGVDDYRAVACAALREMQRQVGDLAIDADGVARRGLLVRHLVMPNDVAGTAGVMRFLAEQISPHIYVNVMDQYRPCGSARREPGIDRAITGAEYRAALDAALRAGLQRLDDRVRPRRLPIPW